MIKPGTRIESNLVPISRDSNRYRTLNPRVNSIDVICELSSHRSAEHAEFIPVDSYRVPGMQSVGRLAVSPIRFAGLRVEGDLEISGARDHGRIQSAPVSDSLHHVRGPNAERRRLSKTNRSQECWH